MASQALRRSDAWLANDDSFGPANGNNFDFTLVFENIFFSILPAAVLVLSFPLHYKRYRRSSKVATAGSLYWARLITALAMVALEIAKSAVWCQHYPDSTVPTLSATSFAAAILVPIAALLLAVMMHVEYFASTYSSSLIGGYMSIGILLDAAKTRSLWLRPTFNPAGQLSLVILVVKFLSIILQEVPKPLNQSAIANRTDVYREAKAGFWTRTLALWVNPTLVYGFRNALSLSDLGNLGPDFSSATLLARFEPVWAATNKTARNALAFACFKILMWPFLGAAIPRLVYTGIAMTMPLTVQKILIYMGDENPENYAAGGLMAATALTYAAFPLCQTMTQYYMNRFSTLLRGTLVSLLFEKNFRLSSSDAKDAAGVSLMTADVDGIIQPLDEIQNVWASFLDIALGLYLMSTIVGKAFFLSSIPCIAMVTITWFFGNKIGPAFSTWNRGIQERVTQVTLMLPQMKAIRMIGLDRVVESYAQGLRDHEVELSLRFRKIRTILVLFLPVDFWGQAICLMLGGVLWTVWRDGLDPITVFPALGFLYVVSDPTYTLFNVYPLVTAMMACFQRIQDFLNLPEHKDSRVLLDVVSEDPNTPDLAIRLTDVNVAKKDGSSTVLQGVSLSIPRSTLNMVVGAVGTGKSVLLKTILGETKTTAGTVEVMTTYMGYCDQSAWLPDVSIRKVIIGQSKFEQGLYDQVLEACSLSYDIQQLPNGDATSVGNNGASMSGGQKQRLALARALYSLAPVVTCDDILSALDNETAAAVFESVFGSGGMLKQQGRTAILGTHSVQWLTYADQVIVMDGQGSAEVLHDADAIVAYSQTAVLSDHAVEGQDVESDGGIDDDKLELELAVAAMKTRGHDGKLYAFYFRVVPKWLLISFAVAIALVPTMERFPEIFIRIWVTEAPYNKLWLIAMAGFALFSMFVNWLASWIFTIIITPMVAKDVHKTFLHTVMRATLSFMTSTNNGALLNRFSQDMTLLGQELLVSFYGFAYQLGFFTVSLVIIAASAQYAVLFVLVVLGLLAVIQFFYLRTSRQMRLLDIETKTPLFSKMSETTLGVEHIRSFGWETATLDASLELLDDSQAPFYYMFAIQRWLFLVLNILGTIVAVGLVAMAIYWAKTTSQSSIGLGLISVLHISISSSRLVQRWTKLETALGAVARLQSFVSETPTEDDDKKVSAPNNWPARGAVEFKNVSASYSSEADAEPVLRNISLDIKAGQKVVIVGRTGSGKSTLLLTLLNFLPMKGSIVIDGVDVSTVPHQELRQAMITLPQDSIELPGSVRDSLVPFDLLDKLKDSTELAKQGLTLGDVAKAAEEERKAAQEQASEKESSEKETPAPLDERDAQIVAALQQVGLLEYVNKNGGIHSTVKSMHFSAGQRQLFNVARAILHRQDTGSRVVLMDEVTSNMDYETDKAIQEIMDKAFGDCTRLVISHRATGLVNCDVLVTMQDGRVAEVKQMKGKATQVAEMEEVKGEKSG